MSQRYHKLLITKEIIAPKVVKLEELFTFLWSKYRHGQISAPEFCAVYLLCWQILRNPRDPFCGFKHGPWIIPQGGEDHGKISLADGLEWIFHFLPELQEARGGKSAKDFWPLEKKLFEFFNSSLLKGIPQAGIDPLLKWFVGLYPLTIYDRVPIATEILDLQCRGRRCVSIFLKSDDFLNCYQRGRDPFSFLLHDFFHAHHFMSEPKSYWAQVGFSNFFRLILELEVVRSLQIEDQDFKRELEYLYSDMNAEVCFLFVSFRAILWKASDRKGGDFESMWRNLINDLGLPKGLGFLIELREDIFDESRGQEFRTYLMDLGRRANKEFAGISLTSMIN